jgi:hypothetical protein
MKNTPPTKNSNSLPQLLRRVRTLRHLNLAGWERRGDWLLSQYVAGGDARHLTALTRLIDGIRQRFGVL